MLPDLLSRLFRRIIAHVDIPGEVSPNPGCRTGVYAFEIGEQVCTEPVNLAAEPGAALGSAGGRQGRHHRDHRRVPAAVRRVPDRHRDEWATATTAATCPAC
jgi:hypothetical protein